MLECDGDRGGRGHRLRRRLFGAGPDAARPRYPGRLRPAQIRERAGAAHEPCPGAASSGVSPALSRRRLAPVLMWLLGVPLIAYLVVILRGGQDTIVPERFSQALFDAAPDPKEIWVAPDAGHEDLAAFGALDQVVSFIEQHLR